MFVRPLAFSVLALAVALCACDSIAAPVASSPAGKEASITDFGAKPDGTTMNTAAIQKAIESLAGQGGGTLVIPQGTFLSGAIFLKPGVNLRLDKGAVLKGSTDVKDYPQTNTRIEGHFQQWLPALVNAVESDHLRITGEGTLDGSGTPFWAAFRTAIAADRNTKNLDVPRPRLVIIQKSKDVQVSGIHFLNSGFWNLHIYNCDGVTVDGLDIKAGDGSPSTDGMDIDSSRNVTIKNCTISVNDDCIALKGSKGPFALNDKDSPPVEHIRVSDCTFVHGGSIVTVGSEATIVRDVVVEHCKAGGPNSRGISVIRLKLRPDTPETYEDIHFKDITLDGQGALVSVQPWKQYFDLMGQPAPTRTVRNVSLSNVTGNWGSFGTIHGNDGDKIEDITFENIDVKLTPPASRGTGTILAAAAPQIVGVKNLTIKNVKLNGVAYTGP